MLRANITIISVGKKHAPEFAAAIEGYSSRVSRYATVSWVIVPDSGHGKAGIAKESDHIRAKLTKYDTVIVLDETGTQFTSAAFSTHLTKTVPLSNRLVFVIGGAYGVDQALRDAAHTVWSLGPLTYPHQLVRVILAEQLYRAYAIAHNLPYHHA